MAHATSLSAITLATKDMKASVAFYDLLNINKVYETPAFVSYCIAPGQFINLQLTESFTSKGWGRPIIYVSDVDQIHDILVKHGYKPSFAPKDAEWNERYFHIDDPSGHEISFAKPLGH
eukprot:Phypoly_transcript_16565.p1 GENE.Phypoly_transcript_16565~~Phypoly_transcript_16565.p1  ORF type:complete len:119 (+),score=3.89 Phypoly_transcript_16565:470-826(+)